MTDNSNRRRHARWTMNRAVACYVDGQRVQAQCVNISAGGIYLRTASVDTLPLDSTVGVTFRGIDESVSRHPIFLFGRAMNYREAPTPGVGLSWEKAVTAATADELVGFLKETFKIDSPKLQHKERVGSTPPHMVYRFEAGLQAGATVHLQAGTAAAPQPKATVTSPGPPGRASGKVAPPDDVFGSRSPGRRPNAPIRQPEGQPGAAPGGLTRMVHGGATAEADLPATLRCEGQELRVTITAAGTKQLVVLAPEALVAAESPVVVQFSLDAAGQEARLSCRCTLQRQEPDDVGGMRLKLNIIDTDEGAFNGLFNRHVKWLHFRQMAGT